MDSVVKLVDATLQGDGQTLLKCVEVEGAIFLQVKEFFTSVMLLEDAKNFRSIYHKHDKTALIVYRFYYSKFVQM